MKKNLCLIVVSFLLSMNSNAQDITTDSIAVTDSIRNLGKKVKILYIPPPKETPKPKEFYSIQLGAYIAEIPINQFQNPENVYHIINEEEIYVYLSGEFNNLQNAVREKNMLAKKVNYKIYIVKVIDNRKIVVVE